MLLREIERSGIDFHYLVFGWLLGYWYWLDVIRSAENYLSSCKYNGQQSDVEGYFASVI